MKTVVLILCVLCANLSWALTENSAIPETADTATHALAGVVKSVSWADPSNGTKSEIVVIDAARKSTHILVTATTTLWDADAKAIMQDNIVTKCHVNVIYLTTDEGINVAKSIKVLK